MTPQRMTGERGVVTIELIGYYAAVMVVVVASLHLFVVGYVAIDATNAARTAARTASLGGDAAQDAALDALAPGLTDGATVGVDGGVATVQVDVPSMFGGASILTITRTAEMPETSEPVDLEVAAIAGHTAAAPATARTAGAETRA